MILFKITFKSVSAGEFSENVTNFENELNHKSVIRKISNVLLFKTISVLNESDLLHAVRNGT